MKTKDAQWYTEERNTSVMIIIFGLSECFAFATQGTMT